MCRLQILASLVLATTAVVLAGYQHLPWQQYYTPAQRWGTTKAGRPPRVRTGQGRFRMSQGVAELVCEFPSTYHIISNIIWERADLGALQSLDEIYKAAGEEHRYRVVAWDNGSKLLLKSPTPRARGLYRCLATGMDPGYPYPVTLFQDVAFYPQFRPKWYPKAPSKPCCRATNYDDFSHHTEYHVKSAVYFE